MRDENRPRHPSQPELYDLQYAEADRGDVPFYVERACEADGPILELACGTGRVHLDLLRAGVDADGVDVSPASLDRLRAKADARELSTSVREGDMTALDSDRAYDLAIYPFNVLQHARTLADQRATLAGVHDALAPGSRFVFDVFVPRFDVICETYDERFVEYEGRDTRFARGPPSATTSSNCSRSRRRRSPPAATWSTASNTNSPCSRSRTWNCSPTSRRSRRRRSRAASTAIRSTPTTACRCGR